ncbi:MAG: hypothetical protein KF709_02720 [Gemmatimonadaceae bacterium]|nr:hypothetical protein [Gemmatimonadaceae bacterium]
MTAVLGPAITKRALRRRVELTLLQLLGSTREGARTPHELAAQTDHAWTPRYVGEVLRACWRRGVLERESVPPVRGVPGRPSYRYWLAPSARLGRPSSPSTETP